MKTIFKIILLLTVWNNLAAGPVVKLNKLFIDMGPAPIKQGTLLNDQSITISNEGDEKLDYRLQSTCECLEVSAPRTSIEPGGRASLFVRFDTRLYKGVVKKYFYLDTNDPNYKKIRLFIKVNIIADENGANLNLLNFTAPASGGTNKYSKQFPFYFFYAADCHECYNIKNRLFPGLEKIYQAALRPVNIDISRPDGFEKLSKVRDHLNIKDNKVPVILFHNEYIAGYDRINKVLPHVIKKYLNKKVNLPDIDKFETRADISSLSIFPVLFAGIIDGINPCAFATIIFLISYLNYLRKSRKIVLLTGIFYTSAVFTTYLIIGLGFLKSITAFPVFHRISFFINLIIALFTFFLAALSLKDYFLARKGKFSEMALQLPDSFKKRIHKNIREQSRGKIIIFSAVTLGFTISLIEFACTGQIYLPTILYLTKMKPFTGYLLLTLYNIMFILPLVLIFYLYLIGVSSEKIAALFKKNVPLIKLLTFGLFILLGLMLLLTRII